ncbi:MAG: helix-turn-helix transcriptional regulator [Deferrisomatales bacterium]
MHDLSKFPGKLVKERVAAEFMDVSARTVQAWRARGVGPKHLKIGRSCRYRVADLLDFLAECERKTTPSA